MLKITVLMDNRLTGRKDLLAEHGLSLHIDYNGHRILFDCGSSEKMMYNAQKMGVELDELEGVVLSHGHYDHAGGFRFLAEKYPIKNVYTGNGFFEEKYAVCENCYKILASGLNEAFLRKRGILCHTVTDVKELFSGAYLISDFPRIHSEERIPDRFVRRTTGGIIEDAFGDEICLALDTEKGLVLLVGCAHPGILNMVCHVHKVLNRPIYGIIGGTHLVEADENRIQMTAKVLEEMGLAFLGLNHCTGEQAEDILRKRSDLKLCHLGPGDCVFFDR